MDLAAETFGSHENFVMGGASAAVRSALRSHRSKRIWDMKKLMTCAVLGVSLSLAACGGSDQASETDAMAGTDATSETDTMAADPTLGGPGDTTSAAGAGAETGAMDAGAGAGAGAGMDPGGAGDAGATAEDDAAGGAAGAGGADGGAAGGGAAGSVGQ
jgi:hypothetical protein